MKGTSRSALVIAGVYAGVSVLWIVASDSLAALFPPELQPVISMGKGIAFVLVTAGLLYILVNNALRTLRSEIIHAQTAERTLYRALDTVPVGVIVTDGGMCVRTLNPAAERLLDVSADKASGSGLSEVFRFEDPTDVAMLGELLRTGSLDGIEVRATGRRGSRALMARASALDADAPNAGWIVVIADVTDAHHTAAHVHKLARGYQFLAAAAVSVARDVTIPEMLETVTSLAVERGGFDASWAALVRSDAQKDHLTGHGVGDDLLDRIRTFRPADAEAHTYVQRMQDGEVLVSADDRDDISGWGLIAKEAGFRSWALMIVSDSFDEFVGFAFASKERDFFDADRVAMLSTLRSALAFWFEKQALNARRLSAEEALASSEAGYRRLFECNPQPMWVFDLDTMRFLAVNDAAIKKYGYSREEFLEMTIADIRPANEVPSLMGTLRTSRPEFSDVGVWTHMDKSGRTFPVQIYTHDIAWGGISARLVSPIEVPRID